MLRCELHLWSSKPQIDDTQTREYASDQYVVRAPGALTMSSALLPQPLTVIRTKSGQLPLRAQPACTPHLRSCSFVCGRPHRSLRSLTSRTSLQRRRISAVRFYTMLSSIPQAFTESLPPSCRSSRAQASGTDGYTPAGNGASPVAEVCVLRETHSQLLPALD